MSLIELRLQARRDCLALVHTRAEQRIWDAVIRLQRAFRRHGRHRQCLPEPSKAPPPSRAAGENTPAQRKGGVDLGLDDPPTSLAFSDTYYEYPALGCGTNAWHGPSRQLNMQPFAIDLDVVARVHTVRVHPSFVCGLASDRAFYLWTVPPAPIYIQTTERGSKELPMSPAGVGRAPAGRNTALQRLSPPREDARGSYTLAARGERSWREALRQAEALAVAAAAKRTNREKKMLHKSTCRTRSVKGGALDLARCASTPRQPRRRRTSHAYHRVPHGAYHHSVSLPKGLPTSERAELLDKLHKLLASRWANRTRARAQGWAASAAALFRMLASPFFFFTQMMAPASCAPASATLTSHHGTRRARQGSRGKRCRVASR